MANVWGYWKCPACGGLVRGDKRNCPGCEAPIPAGVKYMPPNHPEVVKAFEKNGGNALEYVPAEKERKRPNWICTYCGAQNFDEAQACVGCGMPRFGAKENYFGDQVNLSQEEETRRDLAGMGPAEDGSAARASQGNGAEAGINRAGETESGMTYEGESDAAGGTQSGVSAQDGFRSDFSSGGTSGGSIGYVPHTRKKGRWKWILLALFALWCFLPAKQKLTVESFEWQREIEVEEYQLCHESDWSLPTGAKLTKKKNEIHHYNRVLDHYETKTRKVSHQVQDGYTTSYRDLGNGQFQEVKTPKYRTEYTTETYKDPVYKDVPVYQTKYYYDIPRWKPITPLVAKGTTKEAYWPQTDLPMTVNNPSYGDKRQGKRSETYWAYLKGKKGKTKKYEYSQSEWEALQPGNKVERLKPRYQTWFD